MAPETAGVFAQVIPTLVIATFVGNFGYNRLPAFLRNLVFYFFLIALVAEIGLLYTLAFGEPMTEVLRVLSFASAVLLLLLLATITAYRMGSGKVRDE
ncbi:hypothetical protein PQI23_12330 [Leucobacter sp. USCH14]|uniref:hypothetical protein n=1 Tax=Leucobacter sp. USCH14 TaxID=3024838 RepID=UPI00309E2D7D